MPDKHDAVPPKNHTEKPNHEKPNQWPEFWDKFQFYRKTKQSQMREYYRQCEQPIALFLSGFRRIVWKILRYEVRDNSVTAIFTALIFFGSVVYWYFAYLQWEAIQESTQVTHSSANAAQKSADVAARQLELSERPWVYADVHLTGPLTFNKEGMVIPLSYELVNSGNSPALKVWADFNLILSTNIQIDPQTERNKLCDLTAKRAENMGQSIFPTKKVVAKTVILATPEDIQRAQIYLKGFVNPSIIGCIAYQASFKPGNWYFTKEAFDILENRNGQSFAIEVGRNIPVERLTYGPSFFKGVEAR